MIALRQGDLRTQFALYVPDDASQVAPFQAAGNYTHGLQVLALNLCVTSLDGNGGQVCDRFQLAGGKKDLQPADIRHTDPSATGVDYANIGKLFLLRQSSHDIPFQRSLQLVLQTCRRKAELGETRIIRLDADGRPGDDDAIEHVSCALHLGNNIRDPLGQVMQQLRIIPKDFDLDGLYGSHQVSQHIADDLPEIYPQGWLGGFDLFSDIRDHLFGSLLPFLFQLYQVVAPVGLGDKKSHLRSRPPGIGRYFRCFNYNLLHLPQHPVGLFQGSTRRGVIVQHDAAFVHFRQETRFQFRQDKIHRGNQGSHEKDA